jgi:hypothetical protein
MEPELKPPGTKCLKIKYDEPLSTFAFNFSLRRHTQVGTATGEEDAAVALVGSLRARLRAVAAAVVGWCRVTLSNPT